MFERAPNYMLMSFKAKKGHKIEVEYVKSGKESSDDIRRRYERLFEQMLQSDDIPFNVKARIEGEIRCNTII